MFRRSSLFGLCYIGFVSGCSLQATTNWYSNPVYDEPSDASSDGSDTGLGNTKICCIAANNTVLIVCDPAAPQFKCGAKNCNINGACSVNDNCSGLGDIGTVEVCPETD